MAFLFGWQAADLGPASSKNIAGPDNIAVYDENGGFVVQQDCIVKRVFVPTNNDDGRSLRIYLYERPSNALLAQSVEHYSAAGGIFVDIPPLSLSAGQKVGIGYHSDTYIQASREDSPYRYFQSQNRAYTDGPADPFTSTGTGNFGRIAIWADGDLAASGPSITTADDITDESDPATFTLSGNENAPTAITINGEAGSNITFVSEDTGAGTKTYSYEPPLIADDDTADLVVSVDGTTAGATIAYANSYDRDQLTHPATEAEYSENSLSYPNAYATTQPYEWKVIADANASVVTINWNALEADDGFHKNVASYATPVANGVTTVTLGVFVPETGQAYQFDRTITVSDGSVVVSSEDGAVGAALTPAISDAIEDAIA